jgi:hypothetical protein
MTMCPPIFQKHPFLLLFVLLFSAFSGGCASQQTFSSPNLAVDALVSSFRTHDQDATRHILGPAGDEILFSGDPVEVEFGLDKFLAAYDDKHDLTTNDDGTVTINVGNDDWPMPIPLAKNDHDKWYFDTEAGKDEILNRRIGRNELDTIQTCLAVADAQREYAETDPDHDGIPAYAQKFVSDPGKKNGLYWKTNDDEPQSPLGPLVATAASQGYTKASTPTEPQPYRGYFYRMLTSQGPNAPGGARDYIVNGQMLGGFAVVAYPATYGNSGVMTFIINQDGTVYQRDLGEDTAKLAAQITTFDPDANWKTVDAKDETPATQPAN